MESSEPEGKVQRKRVDFKSCLVFAKALDDIGQNKPKLSIYETFKEKEHKGDTVDSQTSGSIREQSGETKPSIIRSISCPASNSGNSKTAFDRSTKYIRTDVKHSNFKRNLRYHPTRYPNDEFHSESNNPGYQRKQHNVRQKPWHGAVIKEQCQPETFRKFNGNDGPLYLSKIDDNENFVYKTKQYNTCLNSKIESRTVNKEQPTYNRLSNRCWNSCSSKSCNDELSTEPHNLRHEEKHDRNLHSNFRQDNVNKRQNKWKISKSFNEYEEFSSPKDSYQNETHVSGDIVCDEIKKENETNNYCELGEVNHVRGVSDLNGKLIISINTGNHPETSAVAYSSSSDLQHPYVTSETGNSETDNKIGLGVETLPDASKELLKMSSVILSSNKESKLSVVFPANASFKNSSDKDSTEVQNLFLRVEMGEFIPPPVVPENSFNACKDGSKDTTLDADTIIPPNQVSFNSEDTLNDSETNSSICEPDFRQLEAVTDFILGIVKEKSVNNSLADKVVYDLNALFKDQFEGNIIDVYGSYRCNLAISTSDINLVMKTSKSVRNSFMFEVYKVLSKEQDKYHVHPFEEGGAKTKAKINFSEPDSGIICQLANLGKKYEDLYNKMGNLLLAVSYLDDRVRPLIIATKIWAEDCLMNEVEEGKLHAIGFTILMVHFLQHHEKPILPVPIEYSKNYKIESPPPRTSCSVGELWLAFLQYFAITFNWKQDVVTINSKEPVSKKGKGWENFWIAIEDPYTGKNIAESVVHSDTAECIKAFFKSSYAYFCTPPVESIDSSNEDPLSNKWQYSFQQCVTDQTEFFCETCEEIDGICDECKSKIYTPPMASVPNMTDCFLKKIREALICINDKYMLTDDDINERKAFVQELEMNVRKIYRNAELHLFGSSINGFGFKNSDLDICMTIGKEQARNKKYVLQDLRRMLQNIGDFDRIFIVYGATIPLVKFRYKPKGWLGDICVNNTLAVHNSKLLYHYSTIDERCKILGCALKLLAKKALIAEVTDKGLSSYSFLMMVIHFLQQTDPPVLPVLQDRKEFETYFKPDEIVEDCNVWFFKDSKWVLDPSSNKTSVEQLWLDLLDYYCSYENKRFITIRQKEPLFLKSDQISASLFNIQDPFIETKNLGCVMSFKKARETENVFRRARQLFRTPTKETHASIKDTEDHFFSTMNLTGRIQKEVHCDLCGKFGHEAKDCSSFRFPIRKNFFRYPRNIHRKINSIERKPEKKLFNRC